MPRPTPVDPPEPQTSNAPEVQAKEGSTELSPIDYVNQYCPNCCDRLHYDYQSKKTICPLALKDCPQNEV